MTLALVSFGPQFFCSYHFTSATHSQENQKRTISKESKNDPIDYTPDLYI